MVTRAQRKRRQRKNREIAAKVRQNSDLTQRKTGGYEPIPQLWFQRAADLPPFSYDTIRAMLLDPGIRLNLAMRAAPIYGAEFGWSEGGQWQDGVQCEDAAVGEFIYEELRKVWAHWLPGILRAQVWGWSAGEVLYRLDKHKRLVIRELCPRHPMDTKLLKRGHERWGILVQRVKDEGSVALPFPKCWFHAFDAEDGEDYGLSVLFGAYSPWSDKWFNGGALDVRRLFMRKDAYGGVDLSYPEGSTWVDHLGQDVPNRDIARAIVEQLRAGGVTTRPSQRDENGNEMWTLTRATVPANPTHILEYPQQLDDEIRRGMGIPDDVISADGTGSWAGKRVTQASFYASLDNWVVQILADLKEQIFDKLVELNFGKIPEYTIEHKPLAEQAMEQQGEAAQPGAEDPLGGLGGLFGGGGGEEQGADQMPGMPEPDQPQEDDFAPIAMATSRPSDSADADPEEEDFAPTEERIAAIADLLAAVFGDEAVELLDDIEDESPSDAGAPTAMAVWRPEDHPRGPDGRFIPRGTPEAYSAAKQAVHEATRNPTPDTMAALLRQMNVLTVRQIHELRKEFGTRGSAKTKAALIAKLSQRLTSGEHRTAKREDKTPVAPVREEVYTVPTNALRVDPKRFQYKIKGIDTSTGTGEELRGTNKWNPELGGVLLVWRDPDSGKDYVVNGHHRFELANRTGADKLNVRYIDAPTAKLARSVGALANIAEGRGSPVDAAKYLRDTGQDVEHFKRAGISMSGAIASKAAQLAKLSDWAFDQVVRGYMDEDKAAAIAEELPDIEKQDKLLRRIQEREDDGREYTLREARQAAKKLANAGSVTQQGFDLFGAYEDEQDTFDEEVEIEAYIDRLLRQQANDYRAVANTRRAERVAEAGNILATDENARRQRDAEAMAELFGAEAHLKGAVADTIREYAARLKRAKRRADRNAIKAEALQKVTDLLSQHEWFNDEQAPQHALAS